MANCKESSIETFYFRKRQADLRADQLRLPESLGVPRFKGTSQTPSWHEV